VVPGCGIRGSILNETVIYYDRNAERFFRETANVDMSAAYSPFLAHIPPSGKILDAGCGSGRDSRHFVQQGMK
jgi:hypothetical protein